MLCRYCETSLHVEWPGVWCDNTGGDCCWGDDELTNENQLHVPKEENMSETFLNLPISGDVNKRRDHHTPQLSEPEVNGLFAAVIGARGVSGIAWSQYTPYFNDGEPCTFGIGEPYISFDGVEPAEGKAYYPDYGWMEDDLEENNRYWFGSYDEAFRAKVGQRKHQWVEGKSVYTDEIVDPMLYYPIMALFNSLGACNEVLLDKFGDHAVVIIDVKAGKVIVQEYDHD